MSTGTEGATIFYTMGTIQYPPSPTHNGATPTGNTQVYSSPVTVSNGMKRYFRAIAYKAGMTDSEESWYEVDNTGGNFAQLAEEGTAAEQPEYDLNGNLTHYKSRTYSYDAQNRLRRVWNGTVLVAEFYYDGKNRQIARNLNGVIRFNVWDGWELLEEWANGSTRSVAYLQGATGIIKSWGSNGTFYYYQDKLGSTTHVANASGALLESYRYDLWGNPSYFNASNTSITASGYGIVDLYAGERWISDLGLYDLRNRLLSSELGRFLQADPIGFKGDGSNLYRYCGNDSVNKSDPMGLENPPARIPIDRMWESAKYWDTANSFQGSFTEWMQRFQPAGMSTVTVTGIRETEAARAPTPQRPASARSMSMRMVPARDPKDPKRLLQIDHRYYKYYFHQLKNAGKPVPGYDSYVQEVTTVKVNECTGCTGGEFDVDTSDKKPLYELPRSGLFRDRVGPRWQPSSGVSGTLILDQQFKYQYKDEQPVMLPGVIRHVTTITNGQATNDLEY
jgi:RHS repeat-associated protein